ncbi:lectin 1c [Coccidioides immitis RS]|uniref:Lectin 1c n=1 Tax=Coccidioides immitis (strain RS) TaxID=246410 RepID=A0A0D8JU03_COCIM|nr:lectin 1c [Coccidioides immitis RS]KJF60767.1 lectin 1c [Coccidioides immitis RS]
MSLCVTPEPREYGIAHWLRVRDQLISLSIVDSTGDEFNVVEESGWHYGNRAQWKKSRAGYILYMGGSGTSGMLQFESSTGETFLLAMGIHSYKRWCNFVVDLEDDATAKDFHPRCYTGGGAQQLWDQSLKCKATISDGTGY